MTKHDDAIGRREFIRSCGRSVLVGALALGALRLFIRKQVSLSGQTCVNHGVCAGCRAYRRCGLPQALSRRRFLEKQT